MKTPREYVESLRKLDLEVYYMGERLEGVVDHPAIRPHVNAAAMTYGLAHNPRYADLLTATSHLNGQRISRFTHIHQSAGDLVDKVKMMRVLGQHTGTCINIGTFRRSEHRYRRFHGTRIGRGAHRGMRADRLVIEIAGRHG